VLTLDVAPSIIDYPPPADNSMPFQISSYPAPTSLAFNSSKLSPFEIRDWRLEIIRSISISNLQSLISSQFTAPPVAETASRRRLHFLPPPRDRPRAQQPCRHRRWPADRRPLHR